MHEVLNSPGHLLNLAARSFVRLSELNLKPLGFSPGQLPVLVALQTKQASTQKELAKFAKTEQPPMAQMLSRMERDGLINKTPKADDARSMHITLSELAISQMPAAIDVLLKGNKRALQGFTAEETLVFQNMLLRLILNLDEMLLEQQ